MKIVASNSLTVSNVNDGTITHTAYAYSSDGTDRFTTTYPRFNLLDGTKDFSGDWTNSSSWENDGTYKGLTVKKKTVAWSGIYKIFTAPKDGVYTFSAYVKGLGSSANVTRFVEIWDIHGKKKWTSNSNALMGNNFDWLRDSYTETLKTGDTVWSRYEITGSGADSILWTAGHKWEQGSTATPYMPSASEATTADYPSYIGQYTDFTQADSTKSTDYTWSLIRGNDGKDGATGKNGVAGKDGVGIKTTVITYAISTSGTIAPNTGWTSSVPSLVKGQYLWTKTVWTYTDNSSETGYSVTYIAKDGNNGNDGIAGKDGVGIKTTTITYAGSTSGTTAPTSGWTSTVPKVEAGNYLWTKTVWDYTDNTSETGYSVAMMGVKGDKGDQGIQGIQGVDGSNGHPGKIVSDTEPSTRFKGLTWKYSGPSDLTASDGTVIHPNTEYYYNGTRWMINYLSANNLEANSITADLIDAKNLKITDGEFVRTIIDGPVQIKTEIKDDYLMINKMDNSHNEKHTIALESDSGLSMTYQNSGTGEYTSAGVNFQGLFMQNNITHEFARLTPQGTMLSSDVPWTDIPRASGVGTSGTLRARINNGIFYIQSKNVTIPSIDPNFVITIGTLPSIFSGVSGFDALGLLYSTGYLNVASVTVEDGKIRIGNPNSTIVSGKVIQFSINIPLG
ncbi:hypothetical protein LLUC77_03025 [Lactococcus lactis subsp. lactis]|uniref:Uncharacterized protein n=3 Tax=Lactococcus lactis TaxID=1358 RepID=A0AAC9R2Z5_LACLL|nr:hypothetical protein [Lactococcus lactis]ARD95875.2 hypothetical protein LL229_0990 [Lactococcus lactis subsp. lactis]ARD96578.1 hypothetical protein LL229_1697 [Lactococcus lactis subsp. lactis]ARE09187.1 hypothetical protein LLUC77_2074 [Lactococcus lactis subsp. lactis]MRK41460.1 hypothetical protein [Lactococcus lactis subsp. lactis]WKF45901.1 hypothetical protein LLUC77_03025 [Lactococcus lactis subsp. lactis]